MTERPERPGSALRRQLRAARTALDAASGLDAGVITDSDFEAARRMCTYLSRTACTLEQRLAQIASSRGVTAAGAARDA